MPQEIQRREKNIRRKVLIVDDEEVSRGLLGFIIGQEYDVIYAGNGVEALKIINENAKTLSLILLDLFMPEMDGYELLKHLHEDETLRRIPAIVLTSEKNAEIESLQLGAVDFIHKTSDMPEVILARVRRSIELAEDSVIIRETENDTITGLYNKSFFLQYCRQHDLHCPDADMDAIVLNVNRFHLVNDIYGRAFGNSVLKSIADVIRDVTDKSEGYACRCESDTFFMYIPHRDDYGELIKSIETALSSLTDNSNLSIRAGIYAGADMSIDIEQRFDRANLACSELRGKYTSSYGFYDTKMHETELFSERLIREMDTALGEKQFRVFYQPKYNISGDTPSLSSAEALIRWSHPELGMISPGVFVPLFEKNGLVSKLDRYVWNEAAAQIRKWRDKYGVTVPVSVNVSRTDIYDPELENELKEIVRKNGLSPSEYLLEITESAYTDNSEQIIETVKRLRSDGFRVEMDDFGSGYSSLNMLSALPIDALKLDMEFIKNIETSNKDYQMVKMMIGIAKFLSVPVIAEGVETKEQYILLKVAGCDIIQGYYFSKPVPPEEFDALIEAELKNE